MNFWNDTDLAGQGNPIQLVSADQWDTDDWYEPPRTDLIDFNDSSDFVSEGGWLRGCEMTTVWHFYPRCFVGSGCGPSGTFTFTVEWDWGWGGPKYTCSSSNPDYACFDGTGAGPINWALAGAGWKPPHRGIRAPTVHKSRAPAQLSWNAD
jgi:hypothetical protein